MKNQIAMMPQYFLEFVLSLYGIDPKEAMTRARRALNQMIQDAADASNEAAELRKAAATKDKVANDLRRRQAALAFFAGSKADDVSLPDDDNNEVPDQFEKGRKA